VGRSVIGTVTTTVLLAYSGGYTAMRMNFMSQGLRLHQILNINFMASEILNVFVGTYLWIRSRTFKTTPPTNTDPPATTHSIHAANGNSISSFLLVLLWSINNV